LKRAFLSSVFLVLVLAGRLALPAQNVPPATAEAPQAEDAGQLRQGQPSPPADSEHKPHPHFGATFLTPKTQQSDNLVAAEDEDDTAVYRHSPSVRAISRWFHLAPEPAARLFEYFNFVLLAGGVLFLLLRFLPNQMRARRETIQKQLVEARAATEQANARLAQVEQRFARLEQEIAGIRAQAEQESAAEEAHIKTLMEAERQRIISSAEQEIAAAASAARRQLKRFAGELAIERASKRISLDEAGDRILVRHFIEGLGRGEQPEARV
jgi:F-type H+-transporting ATPase subunit b